LARAGVAPAAFSSPMTKRARAASPMAVTDRVRGPGRLLSKGGRKLRVSGCVTRPDVAGKSMDGRVRLPHTPAGCTGGSTCISAARHMHPLWSLRFWPVAGLQSLSSTRTATIRTIPSRHERC
jgi:hypothetical protein